MFFDIVNGSESRFAEGATDDWVASRAPWAMRKFMWSWAGVGLFSAAETITAGVPVLSASALNWGDFTVLTSASSLVVYGDLKLAVWTNMAGIVSSLDFFLSTLGDFSLLGRAPKFKYGFLKLPGTSYFSSGAATFSSRYLYY